MWAVWGWQWQDVTVWQEPSAGAQLDLRGHAQSMLMVWGP